MRLERFFRLIWLFRTCCWLFSVVSLVDAIVVNLLLPLRLFYVTVDSRCCGVLVFYC